MSDTLMNMWPGHPIVFVDAPRLKVFEAEVIACFRNADGVEGDWFNCRTNHYDPTGTALRMRDEGTTWSRDMSVSGREALLAAFMLERSEA